MVCFCEQQNQPNPHDLPTIRLAKVRVCLFLNKLDCFHERASPGGGCPPLRHPDLHLVVDETGMPTEYRILILTYITRTLVSPEHVEAT